MHLSIFITVDGGFHDPDRTKKIFCVSVLIFLCGEGAL